MKLTLLDGPNLYEIEQWIMHTQLVPTTIEYVKSIATNTGIYLVQNDITYKITTTKIGIIPGITLLHRTEDEVHVAVNEPLLNVLYSTQIIRITYRIDSTSNINFIVELDKMDNTVIGYYFSGGGDLVATIEWAPKIRLVLDLIKGYRCFDSPRAIKTVIHPLL